MSDQPTAHTDPSTTEAPALRAEITDPYAGLPADPVAEVTRVDFPISLRGYDRVAVDRYVRRVTELVRELCATRSPEAAVQRAVERVGGEVGDILKRAHATAEEVTSKSRAEAEERLRSSRAEAEETLRNSRSEAEKTVSGARSEAETTLSSARAEAEKTLSDARAEAEKTLSEARDEAEKTLGGIRAAAEEERGRARAEIAGILEDGRKRIKELDVDADRVWAERRRIIDDVRYLSGQLGALAESATERFPADEETEDQDPAPLDVTQPLEEAPDSPEATTRVLRAVAPPEDDDSRHNGDGQIWAPDPAPEGTPDGE
jgi:DivIVA domain-containing protein